MATTVKMTIDTVGRSNDVSPSSRSARTTTQPSTSAERDAHHRADQCGQHRLPQRAPGHLATRRPDGAHQPELAPALVHRQQQRDDDAEDGDEDRHAEQGVDEVEERVDLIALAVDVLVTGLELRRRVLVDDPLISAVVAGRSAPGLGADDDQAVEHRVAGALERRCVHQVVAEDVRVEDALHGQLLGGAVEERHADLVADGDAAVVGVPLRHEDPVGAERVPTAGGELQAEGAGGLGRDRRRRRACRRACRHRGPAG